jgi:hypothetical protein
MGRLPGVRQPGVQISKWRWGPLERPVEHPFGRPNHVRAPAAPLVSPERWIHEVEVVIADLHAADDVD